ncbi:hypothetical protein GT755_32705 [Herbidospora sp. NEAU-GS84]|uniref:SDR family NAD(P)-dependent oxidoreductase n=1 Tax=Herbidospora solisilvae TaxID=2696284 RepID=A0A7C9JJ82_9ACTN|nr:hypothetical protein [Herbidospora solisilvae]NAS26423.1 hypothetical protein [Herbidospora solisilvae]
MERIWLVTGAASGLGREIARVALETRDTAVLTDRRTDGAAEPVAARIPGYGETVGELRAHVAEVAGHRPGDPRKIAAAILAALDAPGTPLRPAFGDDTFGRLAAAAERAAWEPLSRGTDFDDE